MSIEQMASQDYERALFKAAWRKILTRLRGESNELLPFEQVREQLPFRGQRYIGMHEVPVDKIVGSMGRYRDFDRAFLPRQKRTRGRWINIDKAHYSDVILPPVELYKMGEVYFVIDGNHRVSVARQRGQKDIDAHVIEIALRARMRAHFDRGKRCRVQCPVSRVLALAPPIVFGIVGGRKHMRAGQDQAPIVYEKTGAVLVALFQLARLHALRDLDLDLDHRVEQGLQIGRLRGRGLDQRGRLGTRARGGGGTAAYQQRNYPQEAKSFHWSGSVPAQGRLVNPQA